MVGNLQLCNSSRFIALRIPCLLSRHTVQMQYVHLYIPCEIVSIKMESFLALHYNLVAILYTV